MDRTDEEKTRDYTNMGSSVTVINNLIAGDVSVIGDMTEARRKEKVSINRKGIETVSKIGRGDLRKSINLLQSLSMKLDASI